MNRAGWLVTAVVVVVALAGCRGGDSNPTVTPLQPTSTRASAPSTAATPTPSMTPTPDQAALLKEAEAVYRAYVPETLKLEAAGGAQKLPSSFDAFLLDPYRAVVEKTYRDLLASGSRVSNTDRITVEDLRGIDHTKREGAIVALSACLDGSRATVVKKDGVRVAGNIVSRSLYFKRDGDGRLKVFSSQAKAVKSCG